MAARCSRVSDLAPVASSSAVTRNWGGRELGLVEPAHVVGDGGVATRAHVREDGRDGVADLDRRGGGGAEAREFRAEVRFGRPEKTHGNRHERPRVARFGNRTVRP